MSYDKQSFIDGSTILRAAHLDHIEDGIVANEGLIEDLQAGAVRYDIAQSLTTAQKAQAQANIGLDYVDALRDGLADTADYAYHKDSGLFTTVPGKYLSSSNGAQSGNDTSKHGIWYFTAPEAMQVYAYENDHALSSHLRLCLFDGTNGIASSTLVSGFNGGNSDFPTEESPLSVTAGQVVAVSAYNVVSLQTTWDFSLVVIGGGFTLKSSLSLTETMGAEVDTAIETAIDAIPADEAYPLGDDLPLDICHRGLCREGLPENTLLAMVECAKAGWKWVEVDLEYTSDGVWVNLHDNTINRTGRNADGTAIAETINIHDITYEQASQYDFGIYAGAQYAGQHLPTMEEVFSAAQKLRLNIWLDIKNSSSITAETAPEIMAIIEKYHMEHKVIYGCSSAGGLTPFLALRPESAVVFYGSSAYTYIDPAEFDQHRPSIMDRVTTGKNKVAWMKEMNGFGGDTTLIENFEELCRYFGIYSGVYCPTTAAAMALLPDTMDLVTSQYIKYSDAKVAEMAGVSPVIVWTDDGNGNITLS